MTNACNRFPMDFHQIEAWVTAHPEVLQSNLEEVSKFPMQFRRVIVNMMSPEHRIAVWREHLSAVAGEAELTGKQAAFLVDCAASLPEIFGSKIAFEEWRLHAAALFTPPQRGRLFETLGPPEPPEGLPLPADAMGPIST